MLNKQLTYRIHKSKSRKHAAKGSKHDQPALATFWVRDILVWKTLRLYVSIRRMWFLIVRRSMVGQWHNRWVRVRYAIGNGTLGRCAV